uniref:U9-like protein n=1 Tax=Glypta fumiferanae TaxID=389681 RepID=A0A0F6Q8A7_9HYME|nr:U9-like protein [Glypta fumiferanae]
MTKSKAMNMFCSIAKNLMNICNTQTGKNEDNELIKMLNEHESIKCEVLKACEYHEAATVSFVMNVEKYDVQDLLVNSIKKFTDEWFKLFDLRKIGATMENETWLQMFPAVLNNDVVKANECVKGIEIIFDVQYPQETKNSDNPVAKSVTASPNGDIPQSHEICVLKRKREDTLLSAEEKEAKRTRNNIERGYATY